MARISIKLRRSAEGYVHWCGPCDQLHTMEDEGHTFTGEPDNLSATPAFRQRMGFTRSIITPDRTCHYVLTDGVLHYLTTCTHGVFGPIPLPDLPPEYRDIESPVELPED